MKTNFFHQWSLKTKVTLSTLVIFLAGIWLLTSYASRVLREDLMKMIHEQQFAAVSVMASDIKSELDDRLKLLEKTATKISPAILGNKGAMQTFLEDHLSLEMMFNGGAFVTRADGTATASFPLSANRSGVNFMERDHIAAAIREGKTSVSKPVLGKMLHVPVVSIATPIRDASGKVIGALAGVIDLSRPNFLNKITDNRYGKTGGYLLMAPQHKLIVTATDKSRIMQPVPAPGINTLMDRYLQGFEGSGTIVDSRGVEVLSSARQIPAAGWVIVARIPTKEAFAPIRLMLYRVRLAALILTLLSGGLIWWLLKLQLSPVFDTLKTLSTLADTNLPMAPLPVIKQDEVGQLIGGFNRLLEALTQRESRLIESEERFRSMFEKVQLVALVIDPADGSIIDANSSASTFYGWSRDELLSKKITDINIMSHEEVLSEMEAARKEKKAHFNFTQRRADGSIRNVEVYSGPIITGGKELLYSFVQDATDRKLAEEALADSERFLKTIIDSEPECIKMLDINGNLLMMNRAGLEMIEADTFEQVKGECVCPLITDPYRDAFMALTKQIFKGIPGTLEFETIGLKGRHVWLETHAVPFRNDRGEIVALLGITRNITGRKEAEEEKLALEQQIHQNQRLESLGVLSGGIAHDFNNILAIITGYCGLIKIDYDSVEKNIPLIEKAAERAAELCSQMLAYAGKSRFVVSQIEMGALVDEMLKMLRATINQSVVITKNIPAEIPTIKGDISQIRQIVMNLIVNASEAIGDARGEILVSLTERVVEAKQPEKDHLGKTIPAGRYVCLQVTDNGCGMDDVTKCRIFEPFYTTKFTGRGLGMSAVLGIINSNNGALQLTSQPGQGTTIKVFLPALESDAIEGKSLQEAASEPWKGRGTILVAEDEVQVMMIAKTMLEHLGFNVIEATDGMEALDLYLKNAADIKLVLTDVGMPAMDGYELFHALKRVSPGLPIIISSGFGDMLVTSRIPREDMAALVSKPYSFEQLRNALKSALEDPDKNHA